MAQEQTATETQTPANGQTPAAGAKGRDAMRAELLADLDRIAAGGKPANDEKPKDEPTDEPDKEAESDDEAKELPEEKDEADEADEESDDEKAAKADPDLQKRLAIVAKAEKRAREKEAKAKAELDNERQAIKRERETFERESQAIRTELDEFKQLKARARYDAVGVLRKLGLTDEDMGPAARQVWAHSKEGPNDPKNREAAARLMKEREQEDRVTKLERELREEREQRAKEKAEKESAAQVESYLASIEKAVSDDHPLAKRLIEKSPGKARARFAEVAYSLAQRDGDAPDADDVLAEFERIRREELEESGVDVAAILKPSKRKAESEARTIGNDVGTQTAPKNGKAPRKSLAEKKAELEAELRAMDRKS